jgi:hypothetical protein
MKKHAGTHNTPAQSGSPTYGRIRVRDVQNAKMDKVHDLPIDRSLKAIRHMSYHLLMKVDRLLAY